MFAALERRPWLPYVLPMAVFLVLTTAEGHLPHASNGAPHPVWYPWFYTVKIAIVAAVMVACRSTWRDLAYRPGWGGTLLAVGLGLLVTALWVGLDGWTPLIGHASSRAAFDPRVMPPAGRAAFIAVRLLGLVVVVPWFEELFWRSFLLRWVIDAEDFRRVPIGRVTGWAAFLTSVLFALAHPEGLQALLTGLIWAGLLHQTKSLWACVVSHMVANLGLGIYVLTTHQWKFW